MRSLLRRHVKPLVHRALKHAPLETALIRAQGFVPEPLQAWTWKLCPQPENYAPDDIRAASRHGLNWELRPHHYCEWHHYFGLPDPVLGALLRVARPGDEIADVGANVGLYSIPLARAVGRAGRVFSVEAHPRTFERLRRHVELNAADNVTLLPFASGRAPGTAELFEDPHGDSGMTTLVDRGGSRGPGIRVEIRTLDQLLSGADARRLRAVKIDVEGFEPEVILGSEQTLRRDHPLLAFEFTPRWSEQRQDALKEAFALLSSLRFRFVWLDPVRGGLLHEVEPLELPRDGQYNLFAGDAETLADLSRGAPT